MALDHIKHEVAMMLAATNEHVREAEGKLIRGGDVQKVKAAGELDFLKRQKAALEGRMAELEASPEGVTETIAEWLKQEWFNLKQRFEEWVVER
ncbi:MAG TPA: hypothetical protein VFC47_07115 [Caulobacteraceae bacterium]|nr:hypothetical protein [Caulobacteraceae bacterium]